MSVFVVRVDTGFHLKIDDVQRDFIRCYLFSYPEKESFEFNLEVAWNADEARFILIPLPKTEGVCHERYIFQNLTIMAEQLKRFEAAGMSPVKTQRKLEECSPTPIRSFGAEQLSFYPVFEQRRLFHEDKFSRKGCRSLYFGPEGEKISQESYISYLIDRPFLERSGRSVMSSLKTNMEDFDAQIERLLDQLPRSQIVGALFPAQQTSNLLFDCIRDEFTSKFNANRSFHEQNMAEHICGELAQEIFAVCGQACELSVLFVGEEKKSPRFS